MTTVLQALQALSRVCDGAHQEDGCGFNGHDTNFGKSLALQSSLSAKQEFAALKMLRKYRRQLAGYGIDYDKLESSQFQPIRQESTPDQLISAPQPTTAQPIIPQQKQNSRKAIIQGQKIVFSFPYDGQIKDDLKDSFPRQAFFDGASKTWSVDVKHLTTAILWGQKWQFDVSSLESTLLQINAVQESTAQAADMEYQTRINKIDLDNVADGLTLRDYQKEGIKTLVRRKKSILADDMGLGKTLQALVAAKVFADTCTVIIIAPVSLHGDWKAEAQRINVPIEIYSWAKIPQQPTKKYMVIADEAHYAQNLKSQRTQKLLDLATKAQALFLLTGTPIKNGRPVNLYPLLAACDHALAKNKKQYEMRYCNAHATRFTAWDVTGANFLEELNEKISNVVLRRTKSHVLKDLPEKTRVLRMVEPSANDQKIYDDTFNRLRAEYSERLAKMEISSDGEALVMLTHLRHAASIAKVDSTAEMVSELLEQGESVVVFFEFTDSVERFIKDPRITPYGVSYLSSDLNESQRTMVKNQFQTKQNRVFCSTIKTGGVGLTLTASSTVILVDRPWTPGDAIQAEDRIHRIGQQNACTAYWLRYGHVDESIDGVLAQKAQNIGVVLGDQSVNISYVNMARDIF